MEKHELLVVNQLCQIIVSSIKDLNDISARTDSYRRDSAASDSDGVQTGSEQSKPDDPNSMPSRELYNIQRALIAATGKLTETIVSPSIRLMEVSSQYFESRALHILVDKRVPDLLDAAPDRTLDVVSLAEKTGIEQAKLGRLMRCLCSNHVFSEIESGVFANNKTSAALVKNEPLRAYILLFGLDIYSASDHLPRYLSDPVDGSSYDVVKTPWQTAMNFDKPRWEWLEEKVSAGSIKRGDCGAGEHHSAYPGPFGTELAESVSQSAEDEPVSRPEHKIFGLAMLGGGRVSGQAHLYDFPWADLGEATVVDVGGGVGGFCLQLSKLYPQLGFVVQDRVPVIEQARTVIWPKENPEALRAGRVEFMPHDFFQPNPVSNADIYWLRYVIHDWSDEYCVTILTAIRQSMGSNSRLLICDQVMNTTVGSSALESAPAPLPANWGCHTRYSHQRDLAMMSIINGIERTPDEFTIIIERAGLRLKKIWDCRSQVSIVEAVLP